MTNNERNLPSSDVFTSAEALSALFKLNDAKAAGAIGGPMIEAKIEELTQRVLETPIADVFDA